MKQILFIVFLTILFFTANSCPKTDDTTFDPPVLISPANGEMVNNNPPLFVWGSVDKQGCDLMYWIELAKDDVFSCDSIIITTLIPLTDTVFDPVDSFSPDTYYWHMCVIENA